MSPVLERLQFDTSNIISEAKEWTFTSKVTSLDSRIYLGLAPQSVLLNFEYLVLRQQLHHSLAHPRTFNHEEFLEQLKSALAMAELLEQLYGRYLDIPREVDRFRGDQIVYRKFLAENYQLTFPIAVTRPSATPGYFDIQYIRETTLFFNWYRLVGFRSIRVLNLLLATGKITGIPALIASHISLVGGALGPYASAYFYFPRFLGNISILLKHIFYPIDEEKKLAWEDRFSMQLRRRWFELANDGGWVIAGLINLYVMTGAWAPYAIYCSISFFTYDVGVALYRIYFEIGQITNLQQKYELMLLQETCPIKQQEIEYYKEQLIKRKEFMTLQLLVNIFSTTTILLASLGALPVFAGSHIIPLAGAMWLVAICLINFSLNRFLENYQPKDAVDDKPLPANQNLVSRNRSGFFVAGQHITPESSEDSDDEYYQQGTGIDLHLGSN